jgi:prepilin-type N-terminal cleavage/methylation domain-containing protein
MTRRQRGFTLIELMFAAAATAIVIFAATGFLLKALSWYDELAAKIEINRHARETFDVLAYGGYSASTGKDGTKNIYGIRGSNKAPGAGGLRKNYALQYTDNKLTLTPDFSANMSVTCVSAGNPVTDCAAGGPKGPGSKVTVQGWLGDDFVVNAGPRNVAGLTVEVTMTIMNPYEIQRATNPASFVDTYRTVFTLNRNENDP